VRKSEAGGNLLGFEGGLPWLVARRLLLKNEKSREQGAKRNMGAVSKKKKEVRIRRMLGK